MNKERSIPLNIIVTIGIIVIFIIPLSFAVLKRAGGSNAEVALATWDVSLNDSGENNYLSVLPDPDGITADYILNVTSQSQVDIIYSIVIENLPTGISVSIDGGSYESPTNNRIIFSDFETILYSDTNKTKSHTITFKAASNAAYVNEREININVIARQQL